MTFAGRRSGAAQHSGRSGDRGHRVRRDAVELRLVRGDRGRPANHHGAHQDTPGEQPDARAELLHRLRPEPDPPEPQNNDLSNAKTIGAFFSWDQSGVPDVTGPDGGLLITGLVQGDDSFAVPGATGCGPGGSLDAAVDAVAGVPSPSGSNHLVLDDASSSLAFPPNSENGQAFANDWHVAFGP